MTRIMRLPPASISIRIVFAPASSAFSSSSFTTDAGRSTTSPAAILLATASGSMRMRLIEWRLAFAAFLDSDAKLVELERIHIRRRFGHEVDGGGGFAKGDDFADGFFSGEQHHHAIDAKSDAAVRRRAVGQRIEKEAEAFAQLLFAEAQRFEEALLNVLTMDSYAAGA